MSLALAAAGCGQSPTSPSPTSGVVLQPLTVISSDGRELGSATFSAASGSLLSVTLDDLRSRGIHLTGVDLNFIVLRESNSGQRLGAYVTRTSNGTLSFEPSPLNRIVWMMNTNNGADYSDAANTPGFLGGFPDDNRYDRVARLTATNNTITAFTVVDGDTSIIQGALDLLNQVWLVNGVRLAELLWVGDDPSGALIYGGLGFNMSVPSSGYHLGTTFVINPTYSALVQHNAACAEAAETLFGFDRLLVDRTRERYCIQAIRRDGSA
jgi:hypothetical protein